MNPADHFITGFAIGAVTVIVAHIALAILRNRRTH